MTNTQTIGVVFMTKIQPPHHSREHEIINREEDPLNIDIREVKSELFSHDPVNRKDTTWATTVTIISVTKYLSAVVKFC